MLNKIKNKLFTSLAIAGLIYLLLTIYADFNLLLSTLSRFNWLLLPLLLLLSLMNYLTRFMKWDYYLSLLGISVKKTDSFSIFMSGLIMSVTPGKMGEVMKAYLVKQITNTPISRTAPIIFSERITDFVSLIILAMLGAYVFGYGIWIVIGVALFFGVMILVISSKKISLYLITHLEKIKMIRKNIESVHNAYESSYQMLKLKPLLYMTILSLFSWFFECLGYYIILTNFNIDFSILWATFSYTFATIVGAISMLPGGLGVTEGSLTFMLIQNNVPKDAAVASTFLIRVVTLWFAVLLGIISVALYQKRFGKIIYEIEFNKQ